MFKKNRRELPYGVLMGEHLEYDEVEPDTQFFCVGKLNDKAVRVGFKIAPEAFEDVKTRYTFKILMQSDIFNTEWTYCDIEYIEE